MYDICINVSIDRVDTTIYVLIMYLFSHFAPKGTPGEQIMYK